MRATLPTACLNRVPIDFAQLTQIAAVFEKAGASIGKREGPPPLIPLRPVHRLMQVGLQVHDGALAVAILEAFVVGPVNHVEHDGAWAEVKRHSVADAEAGVTVQLIGQPPLLNMGHADGRSRTRTALQRRIGPEAAVRDDREASRSTWTM